MEASKVMGTAVAGVFLVAVFAVGVMALGGANLVANTLTVKNGTIGCLNVSDKPKVIKFFVNNTGNETASNFTDMINVTGPTSMTANFNVASLAAGASTSHSVTWCLPPGYYTAKGTADKNNVVMETNEGDNIVSQGFTV